MHANNMPVVVNGGGPAGPTDSYEDVFSRRGNAPDSVAMALYQLSKDVSWPEALAITKEATAEAETQLRVK